MPKYIRQALLAPLCGVTDNAEQLKGPPVASICIEPLLQILENSIAHARKLAS